MVQASERKIRLRDVDQEDNMGTARREAMGRGIRERREERDILLFGLRMQTVWKCSVYKVGVGIYFFLRGFTCS